MSGDVVDRRQAVNVRESGPVSVGSDHDDPKPKAHDPRTCEDLADPREPVARRDRRYLTRRRDRMMSDDCLFHWRILLRR